MNLIDRIFKNWKSSVIGLLILVGSLTTVFLDKASLTEAGAFIVMGIGFFFLKDKSGPPPAAVVLAFLLISCGPAHHLKRANYHLRMAQAKGAVIKTDTIFKTIPIITETKVYDTLVKRESLTDTLFITTTRYSVKLKYDTILKKEFVQVQCKGDTIYKEVPVSVPITIEDPRQKWGKSWLIALTIAILLFLTVYHLTKK